MILPFSKRKRIVPIKKELQTDSIDVDLRNAIWNVVIRNYVGYIYGDMEYAGVPEYIRKLWDLHFKLVIDQMPNVDRLIHEDIKKKYYKMSYYQVYDFLEFIAFHLPDRANINKYVYDLNQAFEREFCGYRMVDGLITEMTSESEIKAIEEAAQTNLSSVNEHIKRAHAHLSNRENPDYRNSIKESISAVEAICQKITANKNATLGDALKLIRDKQQIELPPPLRDAFNKLYGYTNSNDGIRHALFDKSTITFDEAKFMLVSCSAFVNYLICKNKSTE